MEKKMVKLEKPTNGPVASSNFGSCNKERISISFMARLFKDQMLSFEDWNMIKRDLYGCMGKAAPPSFHPVQVVTLAILRIIFSPKDMKNIQFDFIEWHGVEYNDMLSGDGK